MSGRPSPARRKLDEVLADGCWHATEAVLVAVMPCVPPGHASRLAETLRSRKTGGPRVKPADPVRVGARRIAYEVIRQAVRHGHVERADRDGVPSIRRIS